MLTPALYLEAYFETFMVTMAIAWCATYMWNPEIISRNRLRDIVGYNNLCVGFDTEPARSLTAPGFCLMGYFGIRYVNLDAVRAEMMHRETRAVFKLSPYKRLLKSVANSAFAGVCLLLPVLLIVTPTSNLYDTSRDDLQMHFGIFVLFIIASYGVVLAHFVSARQVRFASKVWFGCFSVLTFGVCLCGRFAVGGYDFDACPSIQRGDHNILLRPDGSALFPDTLGDAKCVQTPTVPVGLMSFLDFGWFTFLCMTTLYLPHAASIRFKYKLVQPETKQALRKFKAAGMIEALRARRGDPTRLRRSSCRTGDESAALERISESNLFARAEKSLVSMGSAFFGRELREERSCKQMTRGRGMKEKPPSRRSVRSSLQRV